jgi:hypothetical protein
MVREKEFELEKKLGIELINPFYDIENPGQEVLEGGTTGKEWMTDMPFMELVEGDLKAILSADGLLAFMSKEYPMIGTVCETWETARHFVRPVFIVTPDGYKHPWLKFLEATTLTKIYTSFDEFEEKFSEVEEQVNWAKGFSWVGN